MTLLGLSAVPRCCTLTTARDTRKRRNHREAQKPNAEAAPNAVLPRKNAPQNLSPDQNAKITPAAKTCI
jgi:hypothetical protein